MADAKKIAAKPGPITDVAHPGKSAPADNSRSIVINRPIMQDPMVVDSAKVSESSKLVSTPAIGVSHETTIQPLVSAPPPTALAEPPAEAVAEPAAPEPEAPAEESDKDSDEFKTDEPALAATDKTTETNLDTEQAEQAEHEAAIQKTIESKQYFLPIDSVEKRRSARFVALGIVLTVVLSLAWADVALDAGLIHLGGIKALTHLFSS